RACLSPRGPVQVARDSIARNCRSAFNALRSQRRCVVPPTVKARVPLKVGRKLRVPRVAGVPTTTTRGDPMRKKLILTGAAIGLAALGAQAQTTDDLKRALAQAQAAAEQAQDAARKAQAALEQVQAAAAQAQRSAAQVPDSAVTAQVAPGAGLTVRSGTSFVQLYGLVDVTYFSKSHANGKGDKLVSPLVSWMSGNRWGLTGAHEIAGMGGLKAIFRLESEFE